MEQSLEIDLDSFATVQPEAFLIDVREPDEFAAGHVGTARLVPAGSLAGSAGLTAASVADGTSGWIRSGRPVLVGGSTR